MSRGLADRLVAGARKRDPALALVEWDFLATPPPLPRPGWVAAHFAKAEARSEADGALLQAADELIDEVRRADVLVIAAPIYNFGLPATLKAWLDAICRPRETFVYEDGKPRGLLTGKRAVAIVTSGGTEAGSAVDFATPHLLHLLGFIGIVDVALVAVDGRGSNVAAKRAAAEARIDELASSWLVPDPGALSVLSQGATATG